MSVLRRLANAPFKPVDAPLATAQEPPASASQAVKSASNAPALSALVDPGRIRSRVALVIGNSAYGAAMGRLNNPANDAKALAKALTNLAFRVEVLIDGDQKAMKRAIARLGERMAAGGPGTIGLFFYAGHGVQSRGTNYLIPVGAQVEREADIHLEAVAADTVLRQMEEAGASTSLTPAGTCR